MKKLSERLERWKSACEGVANKKNIVSLISFAMILGIAYVLVSAARWSFYNADDFSHADAIGVFGGNVVRLFKASAAYMIYAYKGFVGAYFTIFLQGFLSPMNGFGEGQLAIVLIGNVVLIFVSLLLLIKEICKLIGMERHIRIFLSFLAIFSIFGFKAWTEVLYWYSGAVGYSVPLSVALLSIVLYLKNKNMFTYVIACMMAFLASGGTLEVAGTSCFAILTVLCVKGYKKCNMKDCIYFGAAVLGALINTVAPGNFLRHDVVDDSGLHIGSALIRSINRDISTIEELLFRTPFLIVVVVCVMVGIYVGGGKWFDKVLAYKMIAMCTILPIVTYFPVFLGYSRDDYFPNRCEYVGVVSVVITIMLISVLVGILMRECGCKIGCKECAMFLLLLCLIMPTLSDYYKYSNTVIYRMYNNVAMDNFKKYHDGVTEIYQQIEESESPDVIIESLPEAVADFSQVSLPTDSENWVNKAIAKHYGKNSVALKLQE